MKKLFEPVTDTIKGVSGDVTKTMVVTSKENNKALEILNNKLLAKINDRGIIATYLMSSLSKITNLEITTQSKLVEVLNQTELTIG